MKKRVLLLACLMAVMALACGKQDDQGDIIGGAEEPTSIVLDASDTEDTKEQEAEVEEEEDTVEESDVETSEEATADDVITDDQALSAIRKYCIEQNPDLEEMAESDDYTLYWNVESSDAEQIVVAYRSYTAAIIRYYIDVQTGDTYVTEFVSGITDGEEKTGETFNVKDYIEE
ncbi:hypothetical protein [Pseudobutyrivibrio sp.]|uniref:hypothetical protein n=1 Tax=Pseudobutyrivibrio sp. TaxID=2014367 RepID=UPI0025ED79E5|nr:hypothetical protein [Pseudobutyrivibrio sp.]MBR5649006.1 hypothetical protein [Pseudobutyrivibrio sp.]